MEKVTETVKADIKKMSDARLISKLSQAGFSSEELETMDRTALMNAWAEIVASGKEVKAKAPGPVGYDPEVEKQRLAWEMRRYEDEKKREQEEKEFQR